MSHESIRSLIWEYSAFFEKNMVLQIEVNALLAKGYDPSIESKRSFFKKDMVIRLKVYGVFDKVSNST